MRFYIFAKVIHRIYTMVVIIALIYGKEEDRCLYDAEKKAYTCKNMDVIPQAPPSYYITFLGMYNSDSFRFQEGDLDRYRDKLENLVLHEINLGKQTIRLDKFFNLDKLHYISLVNCSLTDRFMWKLPPHTAVFSVSFNSYTQLDVTMCPEIMAVIATGNQLQQLPKMSQPYLIEILILNKNPMNNLAIEHIAPLCRLKKIELILSDDSLLAKKDHYCQCSRLGAGISRFQIGGFIKSCYAGSDKPACQFDDLANLRSTSCPTDSGKLKYFLIGIGILVVLLLILALPLMVYKYISAQKISETIPSGEEMDQTDEEETIEGETVEEETVNEVEEAPEIAEEEDLELS